MGKGGGGGSSTQHLRDLPGLYNSVPVDQNSVIGGLQGLTNEETQFLNEQGGIQNLFPTGMGEYQDPIYGTSQTGAPGTGLTGWQLEGLGLTNEMNQAPQYQSQLDQSNALGQYGRGQMESLYGQLPQDQAAIAQAQSGVGNYQDRVTQAENQVTQLEQGTGLYASQQAYVNQAVQSGQAAVQQQLASEGLTSSTQNAMLQNQVAQSGAATAGQLIQGNIQLGQAGVGLAQQDVQLQQQNVAQAQQNQALTLQGLQLAQGLTTGEQALSAGNLQALSSMWSTISQQAGGMNEQAFAQAVGGAGALGSFFQQIGNTYGVEMQGMQLQLQQEIAQAQINGQLQAAEMQAASSGKSSMMGGLGSLFGKGSNTQGAGIFGSGGISGALGGLGGLFSGGSAALGAGGAAAGTGSALAAGGTVAGLGESLGALAAGAAFCATVHEVYVFDNPKWLGFRNWMLANSPNWFVRLYMLHGFKVARFIHDKPALKKAVRKVMDFCLR